MKIALQKKVKDKTVTGPFVNDIDNFDGLKGIKNYCIHFLKDDGYKMGETSMGSLQCINKSDGKRITRLDREKI